MRLFTTLAILASTFAIAPSSVQADHEDSTLHQAACAYRAALRKFECVLPRGQLDRFDERMVDRLEYAAGQLQNATLHPERLDQLILAWQEIKYLHPRVERSIFDPARYPYDRILAQHWQIVDILAARLRVQIVVLIAPRLHHPSSVYRRTIKPAPPKPKIAPRQKRNPWGYETYRQPFGRVQE